MLRGMNDTTSTRAGERDRRVGQVFLAASAIGAARTLNAWRPVSRTARPSVLAFPSGLTVSELPLHSLAGRRGDGGVRRGRGLGHARGGRRWR